MDKIILAGGCFWGMEELLKSLDGVVSTRVGYTGGHLENPKYEDTHDSKSGHAEAIEIHYDSSVLPTRRLLHFFFQIHDPTTLNRQGNDIGTQYRSAIFYADDSQKNISEQVIAEVDASGKWPSKVTTTLEPLGVFYEGEEYHQDYLEKNPEGYTCHWIRPDWVLPD